MRPFRVATPCLCVILVAWIVLVTAVCPESWDPVALAVLGVGFGGLLVCRLPLPRRAEWALAWCMVVGFLGALAPTDWSEPRETSSALAVLAAVAFLALAAGTLVAFCTAMREIALAAGSARLAGRWRSVQRWHIGALGTAALFGLVALPFAERTGPSHFVLDDALGAPVMLAVLVLLGAMIYAIVALVGLIQHLRRSFGLRGLVERGHLVLRQDAWGPTSVPPPSVYQPTPPPWESSTTLS